MTICVAYIYNVIIVSLLRSTQIEDKSTYCTQVYGPTAGLLFVITYIQMIQLTHRTASTHTHQLLVASVLALGIILKYCKSPAPPTPPKMCNCYKAMDSINVL